MVPKKGERGFSVGVVRLVFPSASGSQADELLSPHVYVFSCCRQWDCDVELLERYRQALETAVNISVKHNLSPLPGRTLLVYFTDENADRFCPKTHLQGVKKQNKTKTQQKPCLPRAWQDVRGFSFSLKASQTQRNGMDLCPGARFWFPKTFWGQSCLGIIIPTFQVCLADNGLPCRPQAYLTALTRAGILIFPAPRKSVLLGGLLKVTPPGIHSPSLTSPKQEFGL